MTTDGQLALAEAMAYLPSGAYILTAAFDASRGGALVHWVQPCATEPPLLAVAAPKGHSIEPMIRDSRSFGVCVVDPNDRLVVRQFATPLPPDEAPDLFDCLPVMTLVTGSPIITRAICGFDCEMVRHLDLDADHELYVGRVLAARVFRARREAAAG
jgi:flavin reductase (DIM6/NTAB) family NADH-FMN oxidoreductase RutF